MKYLISKFKCVLYNQTSTLILPNVKYKLENFKNESCIVFSNNTLPFVFDFTPNENVLVVKNGLDVFYFLFPTYLNNETIKISYKNKDLFINLGKYINIMYEGENILNLQNLNLTYSHFEIIDDLCLLYFDGNRNYIIILKDVNILFYGYYDEYNFAQDEKYFMCKLYDSLNHGKVVHIKDKQFESYLVYLDDDELNLKDEFISCVFLDCVLAGNYKYCNELLSDNIKLEDPKNIKLFFEDYDYFYPINCNEFILIKKNTLAGIYIFEIENCKITNITHH